MGGVQSCHMENMVKLPVFGSIHLTVEGNLQNLVDSVGGGAGHGRAQSGAGRRMKIEHACSQSYVNPNPKGRGGELGT